MNDPFGKKANSDILAFVANVAGVASLVLAVANGNLEKLSSLQRWGLAVASAIMFWVFFMGGLIKFAKVQADGHNQGLAVAIMFFGGLICACLLLAILPMFSFGLAVSHQEIITLCAFGTFALASVFLAFIWGFIPSP